MSLLSSVCAYGLVQLWGLCLQQTVRTEPLRPPCTGPGTCSALTCFFPGTELGISLENRNFAGQQLLRGGESARPTDAQQSRASTSTSTITNTSSPVPNALCAGDPDVATRATSPADGTQGPSQQLRPPTTRVAAARGLRPVPCPCCLRRGQRATTRHGWLMPFVPA